MGDVTPECGCRSPRAIEAGRQAAELYRSGRLLCSEAVLWVANEILGYPLPAEAVRVASGFPVGMGAIPSGGCSCGALSGGIMALGLKYGRSEPGAEAPEVLEKARELHDWFKTSHGSTCCRVLIRRLTFGSPEHIDQCVRFTGEVAERVAAMLPDDHPAADHQTAAGEAASHGPRAAVG